MATLVKKGTVMVHSGMTQEVLIEERTTLGHVAYLPPSLYVKNVAAQIDCYGAGTGVFDSRANLAGVHGSIARRRLGTGTKVGTFLVLTSTVGSALEVEFAVYRG
jgi:hypothetical protein